MRALDRATAAYEPRFLIDLSRFGGLPGVRANHALAGLLAERIVASGRREMDDFLATRGEPTGHGVGPETFFAVTLAFVLAERVRRNVDREISFGHLDTMAGDVRGPVRDAVADALAGLGAKDLVSRLSAFTNGFLQASVALQALADRRALELVSDDAELAARVTEAFDLAEHAGRADERSQGRRRLLEVLSETLPSLAKRGRVLDACIARAATDHPEIRAALEIAAEKMKKAGFPKAELARLVAALDASAPKRRDPTTYVGPTRGRARRADGRKERR